MDSTNNYIAKLIRDGQITDNTVILADFQTQGRGQRDANWESEKGKNLLFSMFKEHKNLDLDKSKYLNQLLALVLLELLKEYQIEAKIKWPNDIYADSKKISGVLIENQIGGDKIKSSIIGIGLNVNSDNLLLKSISTFQLLKKELSIQQIAINLQNLLIKKLKNLPGSDFENIEDEYLRNLYRFEEQALYKDKNGIFEGEIIGLDEYGKLKILDSDQQIRIYGIKEIEYL